MDVIRTHTSNNQKRAVVSKFARGIETLIKAKSTPAQIRAARFSANEHVIRIFHTNRNAYPQQIIG